MHNLGVGQLVTEISDTGLGDFRTCKVEYFEVAEPVQAVDTRMPGYTTSLERRRDCPTRKHQKHNKRCGRPGRMMRRFKVGKNSAARTTRNRAWKVR